MIVTRQFNEIDTVYDLLGMFFKITPFSGCIKLTRFGRHKAIIDFIIETGEPRITNIWVSKNDERLARLLDRIFSNAKISTLNA